VVAFAAAMLVALIGMATIPLYGRRRPVGQPLTWGEAMAAATYVFFLMFWAYGVVPHQWLTYAGNELSWRTDKILLGPGGIFDTYLPFTLNYEVVAHMIVVGIYGFFLTAHVAMFSIWQNRGKKVPVAIPTSRYGRPLVRKG
jgi:hypothetical protein